MLGHAVDPNGDPSEQDFLNDGALRRQAQPQKWKEIMEEVDGDGIGSSITIYRAT